MLRQTSLLRTGMRALRDNSKKTAGARLLKRDLNPHPAAISLFSMFSVGIGPSSSHTVGPMRAAERWSTNVAAKHGCAIDRVQVSLYGSLAATGEGHSTPTALALGLAGYSPDQVDPEEVKGELEQIWETRAVRLGGDTRVNVEFGRESISWKKQERLPHHSNGMEFFALAGEQLLDRSIFYSIGGGFFVDESGMESGDALAKVGDTTHAVGPSIPFPFRSAAELLEMSKASGLSIAEIAFANEEVWTPKDQIRPKLLHIWKIMNASIERGLSTTGELLGPLGVQRRASTIYEKLLKRRRSSTPHDYLSCYAIAVNEENANGGRVVTAPTNGAAGIIPAIGRYIMDLGEDLNEDDALCDYLAVCGVIGMLFKNGSSISAAEVGCQGEVGVACSMAAAGLCAVDGGTTAQIEDAAEIGMEHNLGLSCDPLGGLVQIPCIERNVMGAVKAVAASRLALNGSGDGKVTLDEVIQTMWETGVEMSDRYKETSEAGLATNVRLSKNHPEC